MPAERKAGNGPKLDARLDARVDDYIAGAAPFARPILETIRAAFHAGCPDLVETIKWGVPSFERNKMLGGMAAFQKHVSFGFWRAPEMSDPEGLLGETRKKSPMRVQAASLRDLPTQKILVSYVRQAAALDAAGTSGGRAGTGSSTRKSSTLEAAAKPPKDLRDAIATNRKAAAFWKSLAPGYRRDYVEWIVEAKREATREKRLAQSIEWLAEGKRRNWKYEGC